MGERKRRLMVGTMDHPAQAPKPRDELFDGALLNMELLRNCRQHYFLTPKNGFQIGEPVECVNCHGKMPLVMMGVYIQGFVAAGGDGVEICPDWV